MGTGADRPRNAPPKIKNKRPILRHQYCHIETFFSFFPR
jgi:hypothetical protein